MPMFAMLVKWTQMRAENPDKIAETTEKSRKIAESLKIKTIATIYTMGQYDIVGIGEAPSDEAMTKYTLAVGKLGAIRTETLRGYTYEEFTKLIKEMPTP